MEMFSEIVLLMVAGMNCKVYKPPRNWNRPGAMKQWKRYESSSNVPNNWPVLKTLPMLTYLNRYPMKTLLLLALLSAVAHAQLQPDGATATFRGSLPPKSTTELSSDHPIRSALFSLQSLETVRIIEGKV